jgi:putative chitinase
MITAAQRKLLFDAAKRRGAAFRTRSDVADYDAAIDQFAAQLTGTPATPAPAPAPAAPVPAAPLPTVPPLAGKEPNQWQRMVDLDLLDMAFPANTRGELAKWVDATRDACVRWDIDTLREIASFLANINVESAGLTRLTENLNYSVEALIAKFGRHRISVADAQRYGRSAAHPANQQALANILYGGEFGRTQLGNTEPGDGWNCRGFGPKQVTGRANQQAFADSVGMALDAAQAYMRTPEGGMMAAGWFWKTHHLDAKAATPGVEDDRRAINGGTFGLADVEHTFNQLIEEMLRREKLL